MTTTEAWMFFLGWALLLHGVYTLSPVAMELVLAIVLLVGAVPSKAKG